MKTCRALVLLLWCVFSLVAVKAQDFAPDTIANTLFEETPTGGFVGPPTALLLASTGVAYRVSPTDGGPLVAFSHYTWQKTSPTTGTFSLGDAAAKSATFVTFSSARFGTYRTSINSGTVTLTAFPSPANVPLRNVAIRATLAPGQTTISGFVVGGATPRQVLIRAVGPSLAQFGVANPVLAPVLTVFKGGGGQVGTNNGWGGTANLAAIFTTVGAFTLPATSQDAAILLALDAGSYTTQVQSAAGGDVLIEVYFVP